MRDIGDICSVRESRGHVNVLCYTPKYETRISPANFWEVIYAWGETWMWDSMQVTGDLSWLEHSIAESTGIAITDGSYMKEAYPMLNSAAFVFDYTRGRGRIVGSFVEYTPNAGSYRGELLGLMAIHLILKGVQEFNRDLQGSIHIYSDCLGALWNVKNLPPHRILSRCSHSDILKNIMLSCSGMTFKRVFSHVKAHQDDGKDYGNLSRESQLNCQMDYHTKRAIWETTDQQSNTARTFPLEPISIFLGKNKLTSGVGDKLRFWAQKQLAKTRFYEAKILFEEFDSVDWESVHTALHTVPRLFQIWASKQTMGIAPANGNRPWETDLDKSCPSCRHDKETCGHILHCNHTGQVETLIKSIDLLNAWMKDAMTDPTLRRCIVKYAKGRGNRTMSDICHRIGTKYEQMAVSQDSIGWR